MLRLCRNISTLGVILILLAGCQGTTPTIDPNLIMTQAVQTAFATLKQTPITISRASTTTPVPSATLSMRTPPALPPPFTASSLNPLDTPHAYVSDTCQYLMYRAYASKTHHCT